VSCRVEIILNVNPENPESLRRENAKINDSILRGSEPIAYPLVALLRQQDNGTQYNRNEHQGWRGRETKQAERRGAKPPMTHRATHGITSSQGCTNPRTTARPSQKSCFLEAEETMPANLLEVIVSGPDVPGLPVGDTFSAMHTLGTSRRTRGDCSGVF
jgi:hypothetical protein